MNHEEFINFTETHDQKIIKTYIEDDVTVSISMEKKSEVFTHLGYNPKFEMRLNDYFGSTMVITHSSRVAVVLND